MKAQDLLGKLLQHPAGGLAAGGLLGGGLVAALGGKKTRKTLGKAAKLGGVAAIGALAWQAYQRHQAGQSVPHGAPVPVQPLPASTPDARFVPAPEDTATSERLSAALIEAMISAARADGQFDAVEQARVHEALAAAGLGADEKAYLLDRMAAPADPHRIAALAQNEAEASELYLATLLAIDVDHWAEQAYVSTLREALGLSETLASELAVAAESQQSNRAA